MMLNTYKSTISLNPESFISDIVRQVASFMGTSDVTVYTEYKFAYELQSQENPHCQKKYCRQYY